MPQFQKKKKKRLGLSKRNTVKVGRNKLQCECSLWFINFWISWAALKNSQLCLLAPRATLPHRNQWTSCTMQQFTAAECHHTLDSFTSCFRMSKVSCHLKNALLSKWRVQCHIKSLFYLNKMVVKLKKRQSVGRLNYFQCTVSVYCEYSMYLMGSM